MECRRCGLRFRTNRPSPEEAKRLYEDPSYLDSPLFANWRPDYCESSIEVQLFLEGQRHILAATPPGKLLDIGCGKGLFLDLARKQGWEPFGVELSTRAAQYARTHFGLDIFTGTLGDAHFPNAYFDVVTMWDVIEHLEDPKGELLEIRRILKPQGVLLVMTPNCDSLINHVGAFLYRVTLGVVRHPITLLYETHHNYYFTKRTLISLLRVTGFPTILTLRGFGAHIERWKSRHIPLCLEVGTNLLDIIGRIFRMDYRLLVCATAG